MSVVLDVIILALLIICALIGKRKGFVYTAIEMLGWIAVALLAVTFSMNISEWIYDTFVHSAVRTGVDNAIADVYNDTMASAVSNFFDGLPEFISNALAVSGISPDSIVNSVQSGTELSSAVADSLKPVISSLISVVVSLIIFVVGLFLVRMLARLCGGIVKHIPLVGGINGILGAVAGFIKGIVISAVIVSIITLIVSLSVDGVFGITAETLDSTFVFKLLGNIVKIK